MDALHTVQLTVEELKLLLYVLQEIRLGTLSSTIIKNEEQYDLLKTIITQLRGLE